MFNYHDTICEGFTFFNWDVIQYDVEANLPSFLGKRPEEIKTIIVVGAWQGDEVRSFLRFPNAQIFCFEPNPNTFKILKNLYKAEQRVHCYQMACASTNGESIFYETNMAGNGSLLPVGSHRSAKQTESFSVRTVRLDSLVELADRPIDLLWADVQGFEMEVLKGAAAVLPKIQSLFLEVSVTGASYNNATKLEDLDDFLGKSGFHKIACGLGKETQEGNALYLKNTSFAEPMLASEEIVARRIHTILQSKIAKRKFYNSNLFKLAHAITPQRLRTFFKKRMRF